MPEVIEFDPVDRVVAGALGEPGQRTFLIQAAKEGDLLTVVVEKEQVAALSSRLFELLEALEETGVAGPETAAVEDADLDVGEEPLFRARLMRIGFDPGRDLILLELFEEAPEENGGEEWHDSDFRDLPATGHRARLFLHPIQAKSMAEGGAAAVAAGRPICRMCWLPMDPEDHFCPALN